MPATETRMTKRPASSTQQLDGRAKRPKKSHKKEFFPFFELPAELRIAVFEYCLPDEPQVVYKRIPSNKPSRPHSFDAIIQVNRQMRNEYVKIYHANLRHEVELEELNEYLRTFLYPAQKIKGSLIIARTWARSSSEINLKPVMEIARKHQGLKVDFNPAHISFFHEYVDQPMGPHFQSAGRQTSLGEFIEYSSTPPTSPQQRKWLWYLNTRVQKLCLTPFHGTLAGIRGLQEDTQYVQYATVWDHFNATIDGSSQD
ncbi:hypothetical protein IQ07DRAFT_652514 [Pyrenochaeta sp. DS3sAY3a]|nr:hypothetical protein IQ07DRAFT_652514 [Pyrenochaeta sp. DS3sAY3a]